MDLEPSIQVQDTHLKSPLEVILKSSQKRLEELRIALENNPDKLVERERRFMLIETAKLENLGTLQFKLDNYRKKHLTTRPVDKAKEAQAFGNSTILGNHLRAFGQYKPNNRWHAHHIVCSRHSSHAAARFKLFAYMGINDPYNGCWLPQKHRDSSGTNLPNAVGHAYVHTNIYATWVGRELRPAQDAQDIIRRLTSIRRKLHNGNEVQHLLTDRGKEDLRTPH